MRRLGLVGLVALTLAVPATAEALTPSLSGHYARLYGQVASKLGKRTPGRNILRDGLSTGRAATDADLRRSIAVLERMLAPPPAPAVTATPSTTTPGYSASATSYSGGGGYADVPGVPSSFAACVAMRESTDGAGSSNIYGILGPGGQGSVAEQKAAFAQMYAARGTEPWSRYDGC